MSTVLVVDGANVVGSRPDGWWRDRPGAARALHERLAVGDTPHDEVVLVLEGVAKRGVPAGRDGHLRTVHAQGSGDDTIVSVARSAVQQGNEVEVVTADRLLQLRVAGVGARSLSPTWLFDRI